MTIRCQDSILQLINAVDGKEVKKMPPKLEKYLIPILAGLISFFGGLVIGVYIAELVTGIYIPVWVHWLMPFMVVNWAKAMDM